MLGLDNEKKNGLMVDISFALNRYERKGIHAEVLR